MGRGRKGDGVEIRDRSIRISFVLRERTYRETLYINPGEPLLPTPANIKYAKRLATEIRSKISVGMFDFSEYFPNSANANKNTEGSVGDFLDLWFSQLSLKSSTLSGYLGKKDNFWKPKIGSIRLKDLKHSHITKALKEGGWDSGKTRNNYLSMLSSALELAVHDGIILSNPCAGIKSVKTQKRKPDPFNAEETGLIISYCRKNFPAQVWNFVEFWFFTGLRTSEIIGLEWDKVDFVNKTMHIDKGFVIDQMEASTKTSSARAVHLNSIALAALIRQKEWTLLQFGRVFNDPGTDKPWAYEQNFRKRYWLPMLKKLGIRYRRPYCMRSTAATRGLMAGANPAWMAKQLGHSLEVFFRDYADWVNGQQDAAELTKIEAQINQFLPNSSPSTEKIA